MVIQLGATYGQPSNSAVPPYDPAKQITPDFGGAVLLNGTLAEFARRIDSDPVEPRNHEYMYAYEEGFNESGALVYPASAWGNDPSQNNDYANSGYAFTVVPGDQPMITVHVDHPYECYPAESDCDPATNTVLAPIPPNAAVQGWPSDSPPTKAYNWGDPENGDLHALVLDRDHMMLYELYKAYKDPVSNDWHCGGISIFDLVHGGGGYTGPGPAKCVPGQLRPLGWTSGNAAGTPILPLSVRYDEVIAGEVKHTIGCQLPGYHCLNRFVYPARHSAGNMTVPDYESGLGIAIPFGARFRLKADWYEANKDQFGPQSRVVVDAMRRYGLLLNDISTSGRGSWRQHLSLSFAPDSRWSWPNDMIKLWSIPVRAFELISIPIDFTITTNAPSGPVGKPVTITMAYHVRPGEHIQDGADLGVHLGRFGEVADPAFIADWTWFHLGPTQLSAQFTYIPTVPGPIDFKFDYTHQYLFASIAHYEVTAIAPGTDATKFGWNHVVWNAEPLPGPSSIPGTDPIPIPAIVSPPVGASADIIVFRDLVNAQRRRLVHHDR